MWKVSYFDEALEDLKKMDNSQRKQVLKAIDKVKTNPLPQNEGGYGKPLGNKRGINLTNLYKIKLKSIPTVLNTLHIFQSSPLVSKRK